MDKKSTEWETKKEKAQFNEITKSLIPLIDNLMERNKEVTSWEELSERDLVILHSQIISGYFDNHDFKKAARDGFISKEDSAKIEAFDAWNKSLGGYDT